MKLSKPPITLSLLIMDCSYSMNEFGDAPSTALSAYLREVQNSPAAERVFVQIVGFNVQPQVVIPMRPVIGIQPVTGMKLDGGTFLHGTVRAEMRDLMSNVDDLRRSGQAVNVIVSVFTDGEDNLSRPHDLERLRLRAATALRDGWELFTYGFGVDAASIAEQMGFPADDEHAKTMSRASESVHTAVGYATRSTINTSTGFGPRHAHTTPPSTPR